MQNQEIIKILKTIIDTLQPEEKCGCGQRYATHGVTKCGFCTVPPPQPVMTDRDKMAQPAPRDPERDKMFADVSERSPQPVSTVEGEGKTTMRMVLAQIRIQIGQIRSMAFSDGIEKKVRVDDSEERIKLIMKDLEVLIAQVREEERASVPKCCPCGKSGKDGSCRCYCHKFNGR